MKSMKRILLMSLIAMTMFSCDDTTDTIGDSLTNESDQFEILTDTFDVSTRSIAVDSVYSRSQYCYLGHIKDTETGTYVTCHYTTQFNILESFDNESYFPPIDSIASRDSNGNVQVDSCRMMIYFYSSVGDSLNAMKLSAQEMSSPIEEGLTYYTDFDPEEQGLIRTDGIHLKKSYTTLDLNLNDSLRGLIVDKSNMESVTIPMNQPYVAVDGTEYNNYGTYLMHQYYENPDNYSSSYNFAHNVCPGFYIKSTDGVGVMSKVYLTELLLYFSFNNDSLYNTSYIFSGTEEVMQTNRIVNDKESINELINDESCTYIKSPAGIFTEVEIPVESIKLNHENDTISSAKIIFERLVSKSDNNIPSDILMIPKDSLYSFFENKRLPDNECSFIATNNDTYNTYTFNNISPLISAMYNKYQTGQATEDWNKVVLIPISVETNTSSSSTITRVSHEMSLTSTRLVGGSNNQRQPVKISIVYNRFTK